MNHTSHDTTTTTTTTTSRGRMEGGETVSIALILFFILAILVFVAIFNGMAG